MSLDRVVCLMMMMMMMMIVAAYCSDVLKLTDENFDALLAEKQLALVNFYTAEYVNNNVAMQTA